MSSPTLPPPVHARETGAEGVTDVFTSRLDAARRHVVQQRMFVTICFAAAATLALLALMAAADYTWIVPWDVRLVWLALVVVGVAAGALAALSRWVRPYRSADAAIAVEQQRSEYGQRLRTALDYEDPFAAPAPANPALVRALQTETVQVARAEDFQQVAKPKPSLFAMGTVAATVVFCVVGLFSGGEQRIAAGRTLLLPWEYTQVSFSPDQATVKQGESVGVTVEVQGRPVPFARLSYRPAGSAAEWMELPLHSPDDAADKSPRELHGELVATIAECQEDLEFQVVAGPRDLPMGRIRVLQPLVMERFQAHVTPPEYVGRKPETVDKLDLKVMEGSQVEFEFQLSRAAALAELVPVLKGGSTAAAAATAEAKPSSALPLKIADNRLSGQLDDLRQGVTFDLKASAADGMALSPVRLSIRVQPDGKPRIRFVQPPEELEVTPTTEVSLAIEAADDLGLHKVGIACQVADGPMQTLWEQNFDGATNPIQASPSLPLEDYAVSFQDAVTYYAFAEDQYFGQPRRTSTPLRFVDIRPYKRSYQMLDTGGT